MSTGSLLNAQYYNAVQVNQLFRPSVSFGSDWIGPQAHKSDGFQGFEETYQHRIYGSAIIPIKGKLGLDIDLNPINLLRPKELLKVRVYQLFANIHLARHKTAWRFPNDEQESLFELGAGLSMIRYKGKKKLAFYSLNLLVAESFNDLEDSRIRGTFLWGNAYIKNLKRQFFYGALFSYTHRLNYPIPFAGAIFKLNKKNSLSIILPVQIAWTHKFSRKWKQSLFIGISAFSSGYGNTDILALNSQDKIVQQYWNLRIGTKVKIRLDKKWSILINGGYASESRLSFSGPNEESQSLRLEGAPFVGITVFHSFHKSLVRNILDRLNIDWD
ncbi:DUF6268 family outer membrane beta-barrel protein [Chitinophagales bacterium]|nr:DUF6268 family outer membrane beta-barrel protein [Chitinophagales bacterium]